MIQCYDTVRDAHDLVWKTEEGLLGIVKLKRGTKNGSCIEEKSHIKLDDSHIKLNKAHTKRRVA